MTEEKIYFVASAHSRQVKYATGAIAAADDEIIWLGMSEGYPSCQREKANAHKFESADEIKTSWSEWDGMPWYFRLKENSLRIFEVRERTIREIVETEVQTA